MHEESDVKNELKTYKNLIQYVENQELGKMEIYTPIFTHQGLKWKRGLVETFMQPLEQSYYIFDYL